MATYTIPEENMESLTEVIDGLNRKAIKLGCQEIKFAILNEKMVDAQDGAYKVFEVEIAGTAPVINGWSFVASIDHKESDAGNIISALPGVVVPEQYRTAAAKCDHCQTVRGRNKTYIVRNESEYKQVGSSCLSDFLGHASPEAIAKFFEEIAQLDGVVNEFSDRDVGHSNYVNVKTYLPFVVLSIRQNGWLSRTAAREQMKLSTADEALTRMFARHVDEYPTQADIDVAANAISYVQNVVIPQANKNDYEHNMAVLFTPSVDGEIYAGMRYLGYVASAISMYTRYTEKMAMRGTSNFVGSVGEKITVQLTVISVKALDGQYGVTYLHKFVDADNNVFVWFATNGTELDVNEVVMVKGTIKAHNEYNGEKQNVLTRCKVL